MNKDVNLGETGSLSFGDTKIDVTEKGNINLGKGKDGTEAVQIVNLDSGLKDEAGNTFTITDAPDTINNNAVNVGDLKDAIKASTVEVAGSGLADVTTSTGDNGQTIYNVNVPKADAPVINGLGVAGNIEGGDTMVLSANDVVNTINNSGWNVTAAGENATGASSELVKPGETVTFQAGKNLTLVQEGQTFTYATKDDVNFNSVQFGDTTGPVISSNTDGAIHLGEGSTTGGPVQIVNLKSGLENPDGSTFSIADAAGDQLNNAVNVGDLKTTVKEVSADAYGLKDENGNEFKQDLGTTAQIKGDGNINTNVVTNEDGSKALEVSLSHKVDIGPGKDGQDGSLGVNGADGDSVTITPEAIVFHGKNGEDGQSGSLKMVDGLPGLDGANGLDGRDGESELRLEFDGKQLATLEDGLRFTGNNDVENKHKLNSLVTIEGEGVDKATSDSFLSAAGNINVVADGGSTLTIQLNKDVNLGETGSLSFGDTKIDVTEKGNINLGKGKDGTEAVQIVNLDSGLKDEAGNTFTITDAPDTINNNAVNVGDLKDAIKASTVEVAGSGLADVTTSTGDNGQTIYNVNVPKADAPVINGLGVAGNIEGGDTMVLSANDVVNTINNSGWNVTAAGENATGASSELVKPGETVTFQAGKNLTLVQDGQTFTYATKDDVNFNSVQFGDTTGPVISSNTDGAIHLGEGSTTGGPVQIVNLKSGLENPDGSTFSIADAAGDQLNNAVNVGDLKTTVKEVSADAYGLKDENGNEFKQDLGTTAQIKGDGNINTNVVTNEDGSKALEVSLSHKVDIGPGKDGQDGSLGVNGADGDSVTITPEAIVFHGKNGEDGQSGSLKMVDGLPGLDGANGLDGRDGESELRLEFDGKQLATLEDGLRFTGNNDVENKHKLNSLVTIEGEGVDKATSDSFLSAAGNINVVADGGSTLTIQLNKDVNLGETGSLSFGDTKIDVTEKGNINLGKGKDGTEAVQIVNLDSGLKDEAGNTFTITDAPDTINNNAVNVGDLKDAIKASTVEVAGSGLADVTTSTGDNGQTIYNVNVPKADAPVINGLGVAGNIEGGDTMVLSANDVVNTINNSGWNVTAAGENATGASSELVKPGETVTFQAGKNLTLVQDGQTFTYATKDDVNFNSVQFGDTTGPVISSNTDGAIHLGEGSTTGGPVQIVNLKSGLENPDGSTFSIADAAGDQLNNAVNVGDLKTTVKEVSADAYGLKDENGNEFKQDLGTTAQIKGDGNINTNVVTNEDGSKALEVSLSHKVDIGPGKDGQDGSLGVNGADGDSVTITPEAIVFHGKNGEDGQSGSLKMVDGLPGLDGANGLDGRDGESELRLEFDGKQLATLEDGLRFTGNNDVENKHKLNSLVTIEGEGVDKATSDSFLSAAGNINVVADGGSTLTIQLNKDVNLGETGSLSFGDTKIDVTEKGNINLGKGKDGTEAVQIVNLDSGLKDEAGNTFTITDAPDTINNNAVNVGDLKDAIKASTVEVAGSGLADVTTSTGDNGQTIYNVNVPKADAPVINGLGVAGNIEGGDTMVLSANDVVNTINNSGWNVTAAGENATGASSELVKPGETVTFQAGKNLTLVQDGQTFTYATKDDVNFNSVQFGDTTGPVISSNTDGAIHLGEGSTTGGPVQIVNLKSGLENPDGSTFSIADAAGDQLNNAVNVGDLKTTVKEVSADAYGLKDENGNEFKQDLGTTAQIKGDGNINTNVVTNEDGSKALEVSLSHKVDIGPGKDGQDGSLGVNGADGDSVTITPEAIVFHGKNGEDGQSGSLKMVDGLPGLDGANGLDGRDGESELRLEFDGKQLATLEDGLRFTGNNDVENKHKLNSLVTIEGEGVDKATSDSFLSAAGNINVVADGGSTLTIQLNKDVNLGETGSLSFGDTKIDVTEKGNINLGKGKDGTEAVQIVNLDSGLKDEAGNTFTITDAPDTINNNAVNVGDLKLAVNEAVGKSGFTLKADKAKDGKNTTDASLADGEFIGAGETVTLIAGKNMIVEHTADGNITYSTDDRVTFGGLGKDGKDGKDGFIGINGKDGKDGISLTPDAITFHGEDGRDGVDGITIVPDAITFRGLDGVNGKDGVDGKDASLTMGKGEKGLDGNDGVDGKSKTRIIYTKPNGDEEEVATLNDGLYFTGNNSDTLNPHKLNSTVHIVGDKAKGDTSSFVSAQGNINVVADGGSTLTIQLNKDVNLGETGSLSFGDTKIDVTEKGNINLGKGKDGTEAVQIVNLDSGLKDEAGNTFTITDAPDTINNNAVNVGDLKLAVNEAVGKSGFTLKADKAKDGKNTTDASLADGEFIGAGETVTLIAGKNMIVEHTADGNITYSTDDRVTFGGLGKDGKDGKDGFIGINGKDGKDGISLTPDAITFHGEDGRDGVDGITIVPDAITFRGLDGVNGKDGVDGKDASLTMGKGEKGLDGNDGVDGKSKTRIIYTKPNGDEEEVATLNDGLYFTGNNSDTLNPHKLNSTVHIVGDKAKGDTSSFVSAQGNINVVADGGSTLTIQLNKDVNLGETGSLSFGDTKIDVTPKGNIHLGRGDQGAPVQIVNLESGLKDEDGNQVALINASGDMLNNAVNVGDLQNALAGVTKSEVRAGTNVANVTHTVGANGESIYTVNAEGTNVKAGSDNVTVTHGKRDGDNDVTYTVDIAKDLVLDSVTTGNATLDGKGLTIAGGPSLTVDGLDAGGKTITGVKAGVNPDDAVNMSQLNAAVKGAKSTVSSADDSVTVRETVHPATGVTNYDLSVKVDGTTITNEPGKGLTVHTTEFEHANGQVQVPAGNEGKLATADDIAKAINNSGFTLTAQGENGSVVKPGSTVDMKNTDGNIAISKSADDNAVVYNLAKDIKVDTLQVGGENGPKIGADGEGNIAIGNANGEPVRITNVAPGVNGTDAVNVNQLKHGLGQLKNDIDNVGKKANAGVAGAIAQGSIPQVTRPGATGLGIGGGYYGGESAMAIGLSSMSDGGNWIIKGNFSANSNGNVGIGAGALYQW
ncbi:YadA-like family protein [Neisseria animalis]|uniref:YadA-like family protein n=1 Tax=Neisseria animalis TaxID=492 RepID=UPI000F71A87E|nr:YadA-like family protein [Neisseria animalis]VEE08621.1 autotransporter NhhA [Neisseria animalis]